MIRKIKPKSEFSKNTVSLISGTIIAQAIPTALAPIMTRIYSPEEYGLFALFLSIVAIFATMATGKYELAIVIPKSDKEAINLLSLSMIISIIITFLTFVIIYFFHKEIANVAETPEIENWLYFIPIAVFFTGVSKTLNIWQTRKKRFKDLSKNLIVSSATNSISSIGLGVSGFSVLGLVYSTFINQIVIITHHLKSTKKDFYLLKYISNNNMIKALKKYKKMPIFTMFNALLDTIRIFSLNMLIINFFTTAILGQMSLAFKVIRIPVTLIVGSLSQVFFQKIATTSKKDHYRLLKKYLISLSLSMLPVYIFLFIYSKDIFSFVFGEEWSFAGEVASILSIWMFFHMLTIAIGNYLIVIHKQEVNFIFSVIYLVIPFIIFFEFNTGEFISTFIRMALIMSTINTIYIINALRISKKN